MRKFTLVLVTLALAGAVTTSAVLAAGGPRLAGTFDVTGTVHANDFGIPDGNTTPDVWKFSGCRKAGCRRVKLDRDGGNQAHYKSTLTKVRKGVYKGTEGPYPYQCPNAPGATFTAKHTVRVTKTKNGKATAFSGKSIVRIANCMFSRVDYTLKGKLR